MSALGHYCRIDALQEAHRNGSTECFGGLKIDFGQLFSIAPESGRDATD